MSSALYQLDISLVSPGEVQSDQVLTTGEPETEQNSSGRGLKLQLGISQSPYGTCFLAHTPAGLCQLSFVEELDEQCLSRSIRQHWPEAEFHWDNRLAEVTAEKIFASNRDREVQKSLRVVLRATPFQMRVWLALRQIPRGKLTTYGSLAKSIRQPGACRAVGTAVGANPLAYLIPCHRVILASGHLGGYRWGVARKRLLLQSEGVDPRSNGNYQLA